MDNPLQNVKNPIIKWGLIIGLLWIIIPVWIWRQDQWSKGLRYKLIGLFIGVMIVGSAVTSFIHYDYNETLINQQQAEPDIIATQSETVAEESNVEEDVQEETPLTPEQEIEQIINSVEGTNFTNVEGVITIKSPSDGSAWNQNDRIERFWRNYINMTMKLYDRDDVSYVLMEQTSTLIDEKGQESEEMVLQLGIEKESFKEYNWSNLQYRPNTYNILWEASKDMFVHIALAREADISKLELKLIDEN